MSAKFCGKLERELGWKAEETFTTGLTKTVQWYLENDWWWTPLRKTVYRGERIGIDSDMLVARALKNSQLTCGERHAISGTGHYLLRAFSSDSHGRATACSIRLGGWGVAQAAYRRSPRARKAASPIRLDSVLQ